MFGLPWYHTRCLVRHPARELWVALLVSITASGESDVDVDVKDEMRQIDERIMGRFERDGVSCPFYLLLTLGLLLVYIRNLFGCSFNVAIRYYLLHTVFSLLTSVFPESCLFTFVTLRSRILPFYRGVTAADHSPQQPSPFTLLTLEISLRFIRSISLNT